jgi:membrane protein DedA with SNARE-associated domain
VLSHERLQRATGWFDRFGDRVVFVARLVPGTRAMVFVSAGVRAVPAGRFLRHDVLGASLWVPGMLAIGHSLGAPIGGIDIAVAWVSRSGVWVSAAAIVLLLLWLAWGREESKL